MAVPRSHPAVELERDLALRPRGTDQGKASRGPIRCAGEWKRNPQKKREWLWQ